MTCHFKYLLDMAPENELINPISLTKFRKLHLKDVILLDKLIQKTVEIALEKEFINSKSIIVDATHSNVRYDQQSLKEFLMKKSKLLLLRYSAMCLIAELPVNAAARKLREHDTSMRTIFHQYVDQTMAGLDLTHVKRIAVDEPSSRCALLLSAKRKSRGYRNI